MPAMRYAAIAAILLGSTAAVPAQTTTTTTTTTVEREAAPPFVLAPEQRRTISRTVTRERRVVPAEEIDVRVGGRVPATVVLSEFPREVYVEQPMLERYRYVQVHGRIVLVDPATSEVVDIIED